ncbi:MAG: protein-L-isoaspartate O-methyltransferase family protein [Gammaproteobacteria bacterium]
MSKISSQINMIKQQLRTGNIVDNKILDLYQNIDRSDFIPKTYRDFAYSDMQIPLAHNYRMLTPLEEALILQSLQLQGHETVLEVGTGTGFFTNLLSHLAKRVITVDYFPECTQQAQKICQQHRRTNIEFITGNGQNGWVNHAPYDVIVFTSAIPKITESLKLQVILGGKIFAIVGKHPVMAGCLYQVDQQNHWKRDIIFETDIPMLIDNSPQHAFVF